MEKRLVVRINLELVQRNLSRADATEWSRDEVEAWLEKAGFAHLDHGTWLVREADMGQLDPSEVTIEGLESD